MYDARWLRWVGCDDNHTKTQTNKNTQILPLTECCKAIGLDNKHKGVFRTLLQLTMRRLVDWDIDHTAIINGKCENVDDNCVSELFS